jgi:hypothetical protein
VLTRLLPTSLLLLLLLLVATPCRRRPLLLLMQSRWLSPAPAWTVLTWLLSTPPLLLLARFLLQALAPAAPDAESLIVTGTSLDCADLAASLSVQPVGLAAVEARLAVADPALFKEYQVG